MRKLRGWLNYFIDAENKGMLEEIDGWFRTCVLWRQWKKRYRRHLELIKCGIEPELAPALADRLEFPLRALLSRPHRGREIETALTIHPECVELQTVEWSDGKLKAVLQNNSPEAVDATVAGRPVRLPPWRFIRMEL